ncbi:transcriptional repressor LexA [Patescibacteria group bacterium]|nr:transcriptional repressor LexA [Patescibacteria group bacterium]
MKKTPNNSAKKPNELTKKQAAVLQFIENYQLKNGGSPTLKEMRIKFKVSSDNSILKHLKALEHKGHIQRSDTPRGIKMLDSIRNKLDMANELIKIPLMGEVAAGPTSTEEENVVGYYAIDSSLIKHAKDTFLLRIRGDSMKDIGIYEGDLVIADRKLEPKHKDIVVALVDGENTVKRYISKGGVVYLKPENKNYQPIFPRAELYFQGVVTGLIRTF